MLSVEQQQKLVELAKAGGPGAPRPPDGPLSQLLEDFRGPAMAAICKTLLSCGMGREHAEEALQTAYVKFIAKGLYQYRAENNAAPRTYFVRIAVRCTIDLVRRLQLEGSGVDPDDLSQAGVPTRGGRCAARDPDEKERESPTVEAPAVAEQRGGAVRAGQRDRLEDRLRIIWEQFGGDPVDHQRAWEAFVDCWEALREPYRRAIELYCFEEAGDHATCAAIAGVSKEAFMKHVSRARLMLADCMAARFGGRGAESGEIPSRRDESTRRA